MTLFARILRSGSVGLTVFVTLMTGAAAWPAWARQQEPPFMEKSRDETSLEYRIEKSEDFAYLLRRRSMSERNNSWIDAVIVIPKDAADIGWTLNPIRRKNGDHRLVLAVGGPPLGPISDLQQDKKELRRLRLVRRDLRYKNRIIATVYLPVAARVSVSERDQSLELSVELYRDQDSNEWLAASRTRTR